MFDFELKFLLLEKIFIGGLDYTPSLQYSKNEHAYLIVGKK